MSNFWTSEIGEVTGTMEDAFAKTFKQIPDNTKAIARIESFMSVLYNGMNYINIDWMLIDGDFKDQKVSQKIRVHDEDAKKRHRALNMLKLIFDMFNIKPKHSNMPTDQDLIVFKGKIAGIVIRETEPNDEGKQYNWVSEVHTSQGFKSETGVKITVTHERKSTDSAFTRNPAPVDESLVDDVPF
jgi:hypothetical protein